MGIKFCFIAILLGYYSMSAQETTLQPVETGLSLFSEVSIDKVRLLSETEEALNVEVTYEIDGQKKYKVSGQVLSRNQTQMDEMISTQQKLSKSSGSIDLSFELKPNLNTSKYSKPYLESSYIKIVFIESSDDEDSWSEILEGLSVDNPLSEALGESFIFRHEKQWRIGGGAGMVIRVPISPIGQASSIKQ